MYLMKHYAIVVVWCRNQKIYNLLWTKCMIPSVVVWCRNQKIYNARIHTHDGGELWFDVGIKRYTTRLSFLQNVHKLWFDVGIKRYTTSMVINFADALLWFDVGIKRYTTKHDIEAGIISVVVWCRNQKIYNLSFCT